MEWYTVLALVLAAPILLLPVAFVGYLTAGGYFVIRAANMQKKTECAVDTDCGPGLVCKNGKCIPSNG